jgi:hypothetical protein
MIGEGASVSALGLLCRSLLTSQYDTLTEIKFLGQHLGDTGVTQLADGLTVCSKLKDFQLSDCKMTHKGMGALSHALMRTKPPLETINLDFNQSLGAEGMCPVTDTD